MSELQNYKCPNCGGRVEFDPQSGKMKCSFCDSIFEISDFETPDAQNVQNTSENELTSTASTEETVSANKNVIAQPEASKPTTSSHPLANTGIQTIPVLISIAVTLFASFVVVLSVKKANRIKY